MAEWRARLAAAFERVRLPLAVCCIVGGLAAVGVPIWSGWWTHHVQAVKGKAFEAKLASTPATAPAGPPSTVASSTTTAARSGSPAGPSVSSGVYGYGGATPQQATSQLTTPHDVATGSVLALLKIPAIGVDSFVVDGLTLNPAVWTPLLREGPAHLAGSALPGQSGNVVIFGHVNIWGSVFLNLHELKPGDQVILKTTWGRYVYSVTGSTEITPTDTAAVAPQKGPGTLELITCTGLLDAHRLVVTARLVSGQSAQAATAPSAAGGGKALPTTGPIGLVNHFVQLLAAGHASAAWGLWSPAWQAAHPEAAWAGAPPLPGGARLSDVTTVPYPNGETYVRGTITAPGPYGPQWSPAGFLVGTSGGRLQLLDGGLAGPTPLTDLQSQAVHLSKTKQQGQASCGPYTVTWTALRARTPGQWTQLTVTAPGGKALPALPLAPLAFSTYPTWCGDMLGDGSTELIITSAFTGAPSGEQQASIFELEPAGYRLLGQVTAWGDPAYPRPVAVNDMYPYQVLSSMVLDTVGSSGPVIAHPVWADTGLDFQPETQAFPAFLTGELRTALAGIAKAPTCRASGPPPCAAANYVLGYYDAWDLGEAPAILSQLDTTLPPADRSWMAAQAAMVREAVGTP